jgi:glycerol-3-phosphate dehydrogenase
MRDDEADVVVVGAGVQGAATAQALAGRGLSCLVLEREMAPACGVSANSYGIVHGGLRYLQSLDVERWRRSKRAQSWFLKNFPDQVRPLRCVMPLYSGAFRSPRAFRLAFALEGLLQGLHPASGLPASRLWTPSETLASFDVPQEGLVGAAVWHDAELFDVQAVVRDMLAGAAPAVRLRVGAEVVGARVEQGRLTAVKVRDGVSGRLGEVRAGQVVLCAGPQSRSLAAALAAKQASRLSCAALAFNILFDAKPGLEGGLAVSVRPGRGRSYFVRSTAEGLLAGTEYVPVADGRAEVAAEEVRAFQDLLGRALPGWGFETLAIKRVLAGRLPDVDGSGAKLRSRDVVLDNGRCGGPEGLFTVMGVKLTTAHELAERAAELVMAARRRTAIPVAGTGELSHA